MPVKVSIIVAVYNVELWIKRCLDSLKAQTFHDFEVIMVDDGSTDTSGLICDEYVAKDNRFHVIHKANGGVSSARQCGVDNACGEYLIHADPDDWVEPDMLLKLIELADAEQADMVICDFMIDKTNEPTKYVMQKPSALSHEVVLRELFQHLHGSCWNKLLRTSLLQQFGVTFQLGMSYSEDKLLNARLLQENIKVSYLPMAFVHYCVGDRDSLTHIEIEKFYERQKMLVLYFRRFLKSQYHEYLLVEEQTYAMLALICKGEEINHFSASFPMLRKNYNKCNNRLVRFYLFCAFHGFARYIGVFSRLARFVKGKKLAFE